MIKPIKLSINDNDKENNVINKNKNTKQKLLRKVMVKIAYDNIRTFSAVRYIRKIKKKSFHRIYL